jgi:hypothetical protein
MYVCLSVCVCMKFVDVDAVVYESQRHAFEVWMKRLQEVRVCTYVLVCWCGCFFAHVCVCV